MQREARLAVKPEKNIPDGQVGKEKQTRDTKATGKGILQWISDIRTKTDRFGSGGVLVRKEIPRLRPDIVGFYPSNPRGTTRMALHVLEEGLDNSRYISASNRVPGGSPRHHGRRWYIDVAELEAAGGAVHGRNAIGRDLSALELENPGKYEYRADRWRRAQRPSTPLFEGEVLIEGHVPPHAIRSQTAYWAGKGAKYLNAYGKAMTVWELGTAAKRSFDTGSAMPFVEESIRQTSGWTWALAGAKWGTAIGGPIGGLIGGLVGGFFGFAVFDY
jgi:hypothetical protein